MKDKVKKIFVSLENLSWLFELALHCTALHEPNQQYHRIIIMQYYDVSISPQEIQEEMGGIITINMRPNLTATSLILF